MNQQTGKKKPSLLSSGWVCGGLGDVMATSTNSVGFGCWGVVGVELNSVSSGCWGLVGVELFLCCSASSTSG